MGAKRFCVFEYLYRDADNFKAWGALLLKGALTDAQVAEMRFKFESEEFSSPNKLACHRYIRSFGHIPAASRKAITHGMSSSR